MDAPSPSSWFPDFVPLRPVATYSIVARDEVSGEMGVAVQSHWFSVGALACWAEAGVGAVATQAFVEPSYGAEGLALMRAGSGAADALAALLGADEGRELRQVGMVDARRGVATHTGARNVPEAGGASGDQYAVQANMMARPTVWPAMARAFETAAGDLAERMLVALTAAEAEGGDLRGRRSAALLVVKAESTGRPWTDRVFDLRVEDHAEPIEELGRLVRLQRAYNHLNAGVQRGAAKDWDAAETEYQAAQALDPDNAEIVFWHALGLIGRGQLDRARPLFRRAFDANPHWRELARRLLRVGEPAEGGGLATLIRFWIDLM